MENKKLVFERKEKGIQDQLNDCLTIIEVSIVLAELLEIHAFHKVLATQLRLLLCDTVKNQTTGEFTDNSLILKIDSSLLFARLTNDFIQVDKPSNKFVNPARLFDEVEAPALTLNQWLNQILVYFPEGIISIREMIKLYANKSGGAHVDNTLESKAFAAELLADKFLLGISKYILKTLGKTLDEDIEKIFVEIKGIWEKKMTK